MIDLSKLTETLNEMFGAVQPADVLQSGGLQQLLERAGIEPHLLDGLSQYQILELLAQHGIDPAELDQAQLNGLLEKSSVIQDGR